MTHCVDEGRLRSYLDDALDSAERGAIAWHLAKCADCRAQTETLRLVAAQVHQVLDVPAQPVNAQLALARLRESQAAQKRIAEQSVDSPSSGRGVLWRNTMQQIARLWSGPRRMVATSLAAVVVMLSLLAFPPVRAAASRVLDVFRVQQVILMPISPERVEQFENLNLDGITLFVDEPKLINKPAEPRAVASADEASQAVGFPVQELTVFPDQVIDTKRQVIDRTILEFQVNVDGARKLLELLDIHDVTLPDALGEQPIVADVAPWTETRYTGQGYDLQLYQGHSPTMTLPEGTNLQEMGRALLRLLGMDPARADALSHQIDWSSTFILPIPQNVSDLQQVSVGGAQGMLVGANRDWMLYWQRDDRFYVLEGHGSLDESQMIAAAESLR
ncbi:MAG TPA: zf-HC2 domain-containing protein [Herpetosiphonaceae bacterium]